MKIFLLNPEPPYFRRRLVMRRNRIFPPISLAIIADGLEQAGHDLRLLDANALTAKPGEILREIRLFKPDLLIYNSDRHDAWQLPVPSHGYIEDFFKALEEEEGGRAVTLVIGPHGTLFPDLLLERISRVDYLVRGEPEEKALDFVGALERGEAQSCGGVSYRSPGGEVLHNPDPGFIEDLDRLPLPAYHLLPMDRYKDNTAPGLHFGLVTTSRGCPMSCVFCSKSMYGSAFRTRSIDKVLEELDLLVRSFGTERVFFHDQILLFKRERIERLLRAMIERRYGLSWRCQTRLFTLDGEILKLMRSAGCTEIHVGLESASSRVQHAMKKSDADVGKFQELHRIGREIGLSISPNMIIGLPNDTFETVMESARYYHEHGFPFLPNVAIPYPDTQLYEIGAKEGKIPRRDWASIVDAAGTAGNSLTLEDFGRIFREVERMNTRLRRARMSLPQKVRKAPGFVLRRLWSRIKRG